MIRCVRCKHRADFAHVLFAALSDSTLVDAPIRKLKRLLKGLYRLYFKLWENDISRKTNIQNLQICNSN